MRRSLLTEETQKTICDALRIGTPVDATCAHANVSKATYHRWNDKGRTVLRQIEDHAEMYPDGFEPLDLTAQDLAYAEFAEEVEKARATSHVRALSVIQRAAAGYTDDGGNFHPGQWQAAAWYLERSFPKQYARRSGDRLDAKEAENGGEIAIPVVTEERREAIITKLKDYLPNRAS